MSNSFKRFVFYAVSEMVAMTLWAVIFGVFMGVLLAVFGRSDDLSFMEKVWGGMGIMAFFTFPLSFLLFGIAGLLLPREEGRNNLRLLMIRGVVCSFQGALLLGILGMVSAIIMARMTSWLNAVIVPKFAVGLVAGLFFGFLAGLIWGIVAGVRSVNRSVKKRPAAPNPPHSIPPIAAP